MSERSYPALFLFAGMGGGALGFTQARETLRGLNARFHIAGAVDFDPVAAANFELLTGHPCTVGDLAAMEPSDLRAVCSEPPRVLFTSPPCKSFSGCLPSATACTPKYRDMSDLALRGLWLTLEAWPDRPPALILLENVPRIQTRGRHLLHQITAMLRSYGYACRETVHDCGELGGLGQRRRRFLLVARHTKKAPAFWMQPPLKPLQSIGDVIGPLPVPLPGSREGGPMHRLPRLSAMNWLRLALIKPGGDWRDLPAEVALPAREGRQNGGYGVNDWGEPGHAVLAEGTVAHTWASTTDPRVVDPRSECQRQEGSIGVTGWDKPSTTIIANGSVHNGPWQVADPRVTEHAGRHLNQHRVQDADAPAATITGAKHVSGGAPTVTDPRIQCGPRNTAYGVVSWDGPCGTILAAACHDNGGFSVADPRPRLTWFKAPASFNVHSKRPVAEKDTPIIFGADGTWHRPLTTLELAALQGFPTRLHGDWLVLEGGGHGAWRQHVGNSVPPPAAEAIAQTALRCLLAAELGTWELSSSGVWVEEFHA